MTATAPTPPPAPAAHDLSALLSVRGLVKEFPQRGGLPGRPLPPVQAVSGVDFDVRPGETHGLVGESGCGKSTVARTVIQLEKPTAGVAMFDGTNLFEMKGQELRRARRNIQIVFQDPFASLNPRMTVQTIIEEPLVIHGMDSKSDRAELVGDLLQRVGLSPEHANRYPHQFSGGQRQRVGIARALALEPRLIIADEPVSALDVSIQAQVVNLLRDIQEESGVGYLFIAHDLAIVRNISDLVSVMYLGKIVETGTRDEIFDSASHPYTKALLSAVPEPNPVTERVRRRIVLEGDVPSPADPPSGCRFRTRCWKAQEQCIHEEPALIDRGAGHPVACHFPE
ncbi:MAG: ATP-binding cassette domain-containing protein [Acidimicrobiales bacterium]|nr:ATP-binding cassette domain-containing protein [Acidimicrobiales bacterium]